MYMYAYLDTYASLLQGYVFHKIPLNNCSRGGLGIYIKTSLKPEDKPNSTGNLYSDISDHFASVLFIFKKAENHETSSKT